jgi:hypothetical protein
MHVTGIKILNVLVQLQTSVACLQEYVSKWRVLHVNMYYGLCQICRTQNTWRIKSKIQFNVLRQNM